MDEGNYKIIKIKRKKNNKQIPKEFEIIWEYRKIIPPNKHEVPPTKNYIYQDGQ